MERVSAAVIDGAAEGSAIGAIEWCARVGARTADPPDSATSAGLGRGAIAAVLDSTRPIWDPTAGQPKVDATLANLDAVAAGVAHARRAAFGSWPTASAVEYAAASILCRAALLAIIGAGLRSAGVRFCFRSRVAWQRVAGKGIEPRSCVDTAPIVTTFDDSAVLSRAPPPSPRTPERRCLASHLRPRCATVVKPDSRRSARQPARGTQPDLRARATPTQRPSDA